MAIKIKAKGEDAKTLMDLKGDFRRGPHVGTGRLDALNGDGSKGNEMMGENAESRQAEGSNKSEKSDITKKVTPTNTVHTATEAEPVKGFETTKPVNRELPADYPERARRANNQARDMRTNLGRGKPSSVVQD